MTLIQITAPHFCAGLVAQDGVVIMEISADGLLLSPAPILRYMAGWTVAQVREYAKRKGWRVVEVGE